jgi:hypothetical protein
MGSAMGRELSTHLPGRISALGLEEEVGAGAV